MAIETYINFNGNCREAVEFYAEVFGVDKQPVMTFGDNPPNPKFTLPEEAKDLVMHTYLDIKGGRLMFSDVLPGSSFIEGNNISLVVNSSDVEELKSFFAKLKEGGTIIMDMQETFWSKCYGMVNDKFGIGWQLSHYDPS
ncbi:glyoxalase [Paenibacillus stellifer]|uniref:Glyoxalase n=1 Tax=Paenibacillus stellifer TaxID=169760 RepID=A0A089LZ72_9BACL|nr:VOC family protein [Paenibacillus stellifer]AIQ64573.1 glyoxalase [Paenibacillus stellifer]